MSTHAFKIFAHRGANNDNSLVGLAEALDGGFAIETDVRLSKKGEIIVLHDADIDFEGTQTLSSQLNKTMLKELNIALFDDVLHMLTQHKGGGHRAAIHIKEPDNLKLIQIVCQKIYDNKLTDEVFIFDVFPQDLANLKLDFPKVSIGVSVAEDKFEPYFYSLDEALSRSEVDIIWADEWRQGLYNENFFNQIKQAGKKVYVISPELHIQEKHPLAETGYTSLWKNLERWKVDGICTDHPIKVEGLLLKTQD